MCYTNFSKFVEVSIFIYDFKGITGGHCMRFIYITFLNEDIRPGYKKKIHAQAKSVHELGLDSYLLIVKSNSIGLYHFDKETKLIEYPLSFCRRKEERNIKDERKLLKQFLKLAKEVIEEKKPDIVYIRRIVPILPSILKFIDFIRNKGVEVYYEYPTYPWKKEMSDIGNKVFYFLDCLFYKKLIESVDKVTYIGGSTDNKKFKKIVNGVDITQFPIHKKIVKNNEIHLITVAHVRECHGVDKVIRGLYQYYKSNPRIQIYFDIVGPVDSSLNLESMVAEYKLQEKVIFWGYQEGENLEKIFDLADIGVDGLAIELVGAGISGSSLKSREYLARGLPYIYSNKLDYIDNDSEIPDFVFEAGEKNGYINIQSILEAFQSMKSTPESIRTFADTYLSWKRIMKNALAESIVGRNL